MTIFLITDTDECILGLHECGNVSEACFNLPGSYECGCQWGFLYDDNLKECTRNDIFLGKNSEEEEEMLAIEEGKPGMYLVEEKERLCGILYEQHEMEKLERVWHQIKLSAKNLLGRTGHTEGLEKLIISKSTSEV